MARNLQGIQQFTGQVSRTGTFLNSNSIQPVRGTGRQLAQLAGSIETFGNKIFNANIAHNRQLAKEQQFNDRQDARIIKAQITEHQTLVAKTSQAIEKASVNSATTQLDDNLELISKDLEHTDVEGTMFYGKSIDEIPKAVNQIVTGFTNQNADFAKGLSAPERIRFQKALSTFNQKSRALVLNAESAKIKSQHGQAVDALETSFRSEVIKSNGAIPFGDIRDFAGQIADAGTITPEDRANFNERQDKIFQRLAVDSMEAQVAFNPIAAKNYIDSGQFITDVKANMVDPKSAASFVKKVKTAIGDTANKEVLNTYKDLKATLSTHLEAARLAVAKGRDIPEETLNFVQQFATYSKKTRDIKGRQILSSDIKLNEITQLIGIDNSGFSEDVANLVSNGQLVSAKKELSKLQADNINPVNENVLKAQIKVVEAAHTLYKKDPVDYSIQNNDAVGIIENQIQSLPADDPELPSLIRKKNDLLIETQKQNGGLSNNYRLLTNKTAKELAFRISKAGTESKETEVRQLLGHINTVSGGSKIYGRIVRRQVANAPIDGSRALKGTLVGLIYAADSPQFKEVLDAAFTKASVTNTSLAATGKKVNGNPIKITDFRDSIIKDSRIREYVLNTGRESASDQTLVNGSVDLMAKLAAFHMINSGDTDVNKAKDFAIDAILNVDTLNVVPAGATETSFSRTILGNTVQFVNPLDGASNKALRDIGAVGQNLIALVQPSESQKVIISKDYTSEDKELIQSGIANFMQVGGELHGQLIGGKVEINGKVISSTAEIKNLSENAEFIKDTVDENTLKVLTSPQATRFSGKPFNKALLNNQVQVVASTTLMKTNKKGQIVGPLQGTPESLLALNQVNLSGKGSGKGPLIINSGYRSPQWIARQVLTGGADVGSSGGRKFPMSLNSNHTWQATAYDIQNWREHKVELAKAGFVQTAPKNDAPHWVYKPPSAVARQNRNVLAGNIKPVQNDVEIAKVSRNIVSGQYFLRPVPSDYGHSVQVMIRDGQGRVIPARNAFGQPIIKEFGDFTDGR